MPSFGIRVGLAVAVIAGGSACGRRADAPFVEAVPDVEGLTLELTGDEAEASGTYSFGDGVALTTSGATAASGHLGLARSGVRGVNLAVRRAFEGIEKLLHREGTPAREDAMLYGPTDHEGVTYRLTVKRVTRASFTFRLEAKPLEGPDEAFQVIVGGTMARGAEAHRGRGALAIHLDRLKAVDVTFAGGGSLIAAFAHGPAGKTLAFRAERFTPDEEEFLPITAAFVGHRRLEDEVRAVRLGLRADLEYLEGNTGAAELVGLRARWLPEAGGRGAVVASGGDIPEGHVYVGVSCWDAAQAETWKRVTWCLRGNEETFAECEVVHEAGSAEACAAALGDFERAPEGGDLSTEPEEGAPVTDLDVPEVSPEDG